MKLQTKNSLNKIKEEIKMVGSYSELKQLDVEATRIFDEAFKDLLGVHYEPLLVQSQVVAGTNLRYICNASPVVPNPEKYGVIVNVWVKPNGEIQRGNIIKLNDIEN
ncbi:MAG: hypothetical protein J1F61_05290 [Clostridiales bacterium]|nr:hypothetical protein [Clostridiales bacterium]